MPELPDGSWLVTGSRAGSRAGSQVAERRDVPDLPRAGTRAGSQGGSQVPGRCGIPTYHIGSQAGGQGSERRGRRGLFDQESQSSASEDSLGPSVSVAAHKQTRAGCAGAEPMLTAVSRHGANPFHLHSRLERAPHAGVVGRPQDVGDNPAGSDIEQLRMICSWIRQELGI